MTRHDLLIGTNSGGSRLSTAASFPYFLENGQSMEKGMEEKGFDTLPPYGVIRAKPVLLAPSAAGSCCLLLKVGGKSGWGMACWISARLPLVPFLGMER